MDGRSHLIATAAASLEQAELQDEQAAALRSMLNAVRVTVESEFFAGDELAEIHEELARSADQQLDLLVHGLNVAARIAERLAASEDRALRARLIRTQSARIRQLSTIAAIVAAMDALAAAAEPSEPEDLQEAA